MTVLLVLIEDFKGEGLEICTPDFTAFRTYATRNSWKLRFPKTGRKE